MADYGLGRRMFRDRKMLKIEKIGKESDQQKENLGNYRAKSANDESKSGDPKQSDTSGKITLRIHFNSRTAHRAAYRRWGARPPGAGGV
jgi:hypothetical protein